MRNYLCDFENLNSPCKVWEWSGDRVKMSQRLGQLVQSVKDHDYNQSIVTEGIESNAGRNLNGSQDSAIVAQVSKIKDNSNSVSNS